MIEQGPRRARKTLVLVPGTSGGAAYFRPVAADLVKRLKGWRVWSVDRRENLLEDHSALDRALARQITPRRLFRYYLEWIGDPSITPHFTPVADATVPYARRWGMNVAVRDLRNVIRAAGRGGRDVVLGGHSLGGTITVAYATWDFGGRPGAKDLDGLVLIDGGSSRSSTLTRAGARQQLDDLDAALAVARPHRRRAPVVGRRVQHRRVDRDADRARRALRPRRLAVPAGRPAAAGAGDQRAAATATRSTTTRRPTA